MRRRIGTVVETELTVIALIDDPMVVGRCELGDVSLIPVDAVEQRVERRTKIEAAPAAIADFIDALRVFLELRWDRWDRSDSGHSRCSDQKAISGQLSAPGRSPTLIQPLLNN